MSKEFLTTDPSSINGVKYRTLNVQIEELMNSYKLTEKDATAVYNLDDDDGMIELSDGKNAHARRSDYFDDEYYLDIYISGSGTVMSKYCYDG